ncbi:YadA-like family protein [Aggregatibacter sp.]
MNHIYKSIFNKALGVFTAVPEFASAHGKSSERTVVGRVAKGTAGFAASALAISVGSALTFTSAVAAGAPGIYVNNGNDPACMAFIDDIHVAPVQVIYGGSKRVILPDGLTPGTALSPDTAFNLAGRNPCVAVGGTAAENHDTQTNRTLFYNDKQLTLGGRLDVNSGIIGVGDRGTDGVGATNSIRMGTGTTLDNANKKVNTIAVGVNASTPEDHGIAIGEQSAASGVLGSLAIGKNAVAAGPVSLAQGTHAYASDRSGVAIGEEAKSSGIGHVAMGFRANAQTADADKDDTPATNKASYGVTIGHFAGSEYTGTDNVSTVAIGNKAGQYNTGGNRNVQIGDYSGRYVNGSANVAIGSSAGSGDDTNRLTVNDTTSIGNNAKALTDQSIAIGRNSQSGKADVFSGNKSIAIGDTASAMGTTSISIGSNSSTSNGHDSIAFGTNASTSNQKATAIGSFSAATGKQSLVIANNYGSKGVQPISVASGDRATAIGVETTVSGNNSVAIGDTNTVASHRTYAMGNNINVAANTDDSLVFGTRAHTDFSRSIAMGVNASTQGQTGVAIGDNAVTNGVYQISIGHKAGDVTETDNKKTRRPNLGNFGVMIGHYAGAEYTEDEVTPVNHQHGTVAVGTQAGRAGKDSWSNIAVGNQAGRAVHGNDNIAIGVNSGSGKMTDKVESDGKDVSTVNEYLNVKHSISVGTMSTAKNNYSIAIGTVASAGNGQKEADGSTKNGYSVAIGTSANASALNSMALGAGASASHEYSVALGRDSKTSDVHTGAYTLNTSYTAAGLPVAANGTVSVGSAGKERQIQNVAAGVISATSTDAINGSQLYATNNYMNNFAGDVKTKLGGNAALANDGHLTMTNIGGTGKDNVNDAIAAANTKVAAGDNITVTPTTNADGSKTYTVATTKDLVVNSVKAGDTTVNTDGVTIAGGPSVQKTGINAGNKKITGVANGNVAAGSTDAVNGGQLAEVKAKADSAVQNVVSANPTALTATKAGDTVTLTPNVIAGDLVNPATGAVNTPAAGDAGKLVTAGTVANALANTHFVVDTAKTDGELDAASKHDQKIKSGNKVTLQAGKNLKAKQTNAADGATVEFSLKDSISLTQVTAGTGDNQVVLGNNGVQVGGNTYINKDGLNANSKPISNVADGVKPKDAVNKGQLDAVAQEAAKHTTVKAGKNVEVSEGNNAAGGKEYTVKTADNLNVTSVKAGDTTVNTDGVTITGGPSVKKDGINAGNKKITGVADGNVAAGSTDAVNGGQLAEVKAKADSAVQNVVSANPTALTATKAGDTVTLTPNFIAGNLVDPTTGAVNTPAAGDEGKLVSAKTVADALKANHFVVDTKANGGKTEAGSEADAKVGSGNKVTFEAGKNLVAKQANTANGGATVKFSLQDDISLNSVTAGTGDNQVVLGNDGVKVGGKTYINNDGLNANDKKITNVAPGAVTPTSKDAVNGGQLYDVAKNVADLVGPDAKIDPATGKVSVADPAQGIGGTGKDNIGDAIKAVNATAAKHTTVVEGKNVKVTKGKNAAGGDEYTVATKDDLDVTSVTAGNTTVNTNGLTITGGPSVTRGGIDAGNRVISGVKAGDVSATSQEAVNGSQLHATNTKLDGVKAKADTAVQDVKSGDENALTAVKDPNTNIVTVTPKLSGDLVDADGNITAPATPADKGKLVTAGTVAQALANTHFVVDTKATDGELDTASQADQKIKAGNKVTLQAGKNLKAKQTNGANGAQVEFSLKDSISLTQVTAGDSTLNTDGLTIAGGPSVKKDGIDAGDKKITNVAPGAVTPTSKDAVNGSQLYNVANNVKDLIGPDATIDPATGKVTVADPAKGIGETGKGTIGEAIKSVKDKADTAVQDIKSGDEKALSVTKAGNTYTITPNLSGDLVDADGNITAPATDADKGKLVTAGTVAQALANTHFVVDTKATDGELDGASEADQKIKAGNKVTLQAGKNLKAKQTNGANGAQVEFSLKDSISLKEVTAGEGDNQVVLGNDGVKVGGNTYINKDGLNANNKVISNVADGVNPNDAVNKGQLDAVGKEAAKHTTVKAGKNVEVTEGTNAAGGKEYTVKTADNLDVTSVKAGDSTLNTDGLTIAGGPSVKKDGINAGDKKITNVAPGAVTPTSKDAVNGSQLYNVANNVKDLIGPDATIDPATGKVTVADPAKGIGETGKGNIGDAIKHVNDAAKAAADTAKKHSSVKAGDNIVVTEGTNAAGGKEYTVSTAKDLNVDSVKAGDTTVNNDGLTIAGGPSVKKDGIDAGDKKITNVADGVDAADAVNKGQLDKVAQNVVNVLGGNATVNGNGDITMSNIGDTGKGNVNDAIKAVNDLAKKAAAEKTSVKAKDGRSNVTVTEGVNAAGGHEYTVDVERAVTEAGSDQVTVTSKHDADSNTTTYTVDVSDKTKASLAKADSAVQGLTSKDGNLNFNKDPNGNVEVSFNDNLNVKNVTTDRVQVANGPSMSKDGINAAGKAISNVANGNVAADSKDAVNGGQLYDTAKSVADVIGGGATVKDGKVVAGQNGIGNTGQNTVHGAIAAINQNTANNFNQIRGDLRKMDRDLRGGIAGALATAGLPQAFRPGKSMVAAAASTYRGQSGLAIGVSRISDNGKIILKVTGNTNSRGDFGGTIGAGYQW